MAKWNDPLGGGHSSGKALLADLAAYAEKITLDA